MVCHEHQPTKADRRAILRLVEQCLSGLGILRPSGCRAAGGVPKKQLNNLLVDLSKVYDALDGAIEAALHENHDGVVAWDQGAIDDAAYSFQADMERSLLKSVEAAIQAGLSDAADALDEPDIVYTNVDPGIVANLEGQSINLCAKTAAKITGDVKGQLLESQRLGETMNQAMDRIRSISSLSDYEIERICRTELAKAANAARLEGYKGRVEKVMWVLGPAYRGGCGCAELAGEYTLEEAQGLQMPLHPNCDCFWAPVLAAAA